MKNRNIQRFYLESLGCAKNSVDSHAMAAMLLKAGYNAAQDAHSADVIIVNTCGFIKPAQDESIDVLNDYAAQKVKGQYLIAAGCLSERDRQKLTDKVPGLDAALSTRRWVDILQVINHLSESSDTPYYHFPPAESLITDYEHVHIVAVQGKSAYLKIADGCDRHCAFCAIPSIKGRMVSRLPEDIYRDAEYLETLGVKEIILIAQDTTAYGRDLGLHNGLATLLESLVERVKKVPWIRIMYTFPGAITERLITVMRDNHQILPYLDIPLQHAHPQVLRRMRRPAEMDQVCETLALMKQKIPSLALRTTFIVGFPGETDREFSALTDFITEIEFDHVGIFPYYHEEDTPSFSYEDDVPQAVKDERIQTLARLQEDISLKKNQAWIGRQMKVLIEGNGDGVSIGRSYRDAPEIDGLVFLDTVIDTGKMVQAKITGALVHDLIGVKK